MFLRLVKNWENKATNLEVVKCKKTTLSCNIDFFKKEISNHISYVFRIKATKISNHCWKFELETSCPITGLLIKETEFKPLIYAQILKLLDHSVRGPHTLNWVWAKGGGLFSGNFWGVPNFWVLLHFYVSFSKFLLY